MLLGLSRMDVKQFSFLQTRNLQYHLRNSAPDLTNTWQGPSSRIWGCWSHLFYNNNLLQDKYEKIEQNTVRGTRIQLRTDLRIRFPRSEDSTRNELILQQTLREKPNLHWEIHPAVAAP